MPVAEQQNRGNILEQGGHMDIGSVSTQNSAAQLGQLLKTITAERNGLSEKLIGMSVEQKVSNDKLGNTIDMIA